MSELFFRVIIDTIIVMHKTRRNVLLRRVGHLPFVPKEGFKVRLTNEGNETFDVEFVNLVYDFEARAFVEEHEDSTLVDELREGDGPEVTVTLDRLQQYIDFYKSFGWEVINGPAQKAPQVES
jgi:hypothetical protein